MLNALKGKNGLEAGEGEGARRLQLAVVGGGGRLVTQRTAGEVGAARAGPQTPLCTLGGQPFCLNPGFLTCKVGGGLV